MDVGGLLSGPQAYGGNGSLNQDVIRGKKERRGNGMSKSQEQSFRKISFFFFLRESGCRSLLLCGQSYFVGRAFSSSDVGCCVSCTCIFYVCLHHAELGQSRKTSPHPSALGRDTSRFLLREAEDATVNQPK